MWAKPHSFEPRRSSTNEQGAHAPHTHKSEEARERKTCKESPTPAGLPRAPTPVLATGHAWQACLHQPACQAKSSIVASSCPCPAADSPATTRGKFEAAMFESLSVCKQERRRSHFTRRAAHGSFGRDTAALRFVDLTGEAVGAKKSTKVTRNQALLQTETGNLYAGGRPCARASNLKAPMCMSRWFHHAFRMSCQKSSSFRRARYILRKRCPACCACTFRSHTGHRVG